MHRERLIRAVVASSAECGYAEMTVADVVRRARVSRNVFYEHFADKHAAFLVALDNGAELIFDRIAAAGGGPGSGSDAVDRLRAAIHAYLHFLATEPEFARCFLIEVFAAGPHALERLRAAQTRFVAGIARWHALARAQHPNWPEVPEEAYLALLGAMHEIVRTRVGERRTAELPELEPTALALYLTTLTGWRRTP